MEKADGRGRALRRICVGGRKRDAFDGIVPLFNVVGRDGTFDVFTDDDDDDDCTNVAFAFSFDTRNDSGVSPRLRLLFELSDERLYKWIQ